MPARDYRRLQKQGNTFWCRIWQFLGTGFSFLLQTPSDSPFPQAFHGDQWAVVEMEGQESSVLLLMKNLVRIQCSGKYSVLDWLSELNWQALPILQSMFSLQFLGTTVLNCLSFVFTQGRICNNWGFCCFKTLNDIKVLTASLAGTITGWNPKIGGASVKHHSECLRWSANVHHSIILSLEGGGKNQSV